MTEATKVRARGRILDAQGRPFRATVFPYRREAGEPAWRVLAKDGEARPGTPAHAHGWVHDVPTAQAMGRDFELGEGYFEVPGGVPPGTYVLHVHPRDGRPHQWNGPVVWDGTDEVLQVTPWGRSDSPANEPAKRPLTVTREGTLVGEGLIQNRLLGVECLNALSVRRSDPARAVEVVKSHGLNVLRVLTILPRFGGLDVSDQMTSADPWFVSPWTNPGEWRRKLADMAAACEALDVYLVLCLLDKHDREDKARAELAKVVANPSRQDTYRGEERRTTAFALELIRDVYLAGLDPRRNARVIPQVRNEPHLDHSDVEDKPIAEALRADGWPVISVNTRYSRPGPYAGELIEEHQWGNGKPWPSPMLEHIKATRHQNSIPTGKAHVVSSSDGQDFSPFPETVERGVRSAWRRGFSVQVLFRRPPDLWTPTDHESARAIRRGAGLRPLR